MHRSKALKFRFLSTRFAWAAIHPKPIGIIYFIGGAFFGSLPTLFYRYLLNGLFQEGYTIVALPFRFSFRHWSVALSLAANQSSIRQCLLEEARKLDYETALYQSDSQDERVKEYWVGHSLGCKYIALMELLTDYEHLDKQSAILDCLGERQTRQISQLVDQASLESVSLYNQPAVLLDPVISDLDNAVPTKALQRLFSRLVQVLPSRDETFLLIEKSRLFGLMSIISFESQLSKGPIAKLKRVLVDQRPGFHTPAIGKRLLGKHLATLGIGSGEQSILDVVIEDLRRYQAK
jgi:hypothetical protein